MPHYLDADAASLPPVAARFARYVRIDTQSDPGSTSVPTTEKQKDLSRLLRDELVALGVAAEMDEAGYVYATLPAVGEGATAPRLGLVAHVDTSSDEPGGPVRPLVWPDYQGETLTLPGNPDVRLGPENQPALLDHLGHDLLTSDGTTLLGSDDKAGVALIMQLTEELLADPRPRPELRILFTVDEEVGRGVDHLDYERFGAEVAYTVDGGGVGGLYAETFHAAEAVVQVEGVTVHPGYAKGILVNALAIAADICAALPPDESPATTEGRDGYFYPHTMAPADTGLATLRILLRDFEADGLAQRKTIIEHLVEAARERHPGARIALRIEDSYRNMRSYIDEADPRTVTIAEAAFREAGIEPELRLIRGGTDGARLSERGIPTPNLFTGGHAFHSRFEWNTVQNLDAALRCLHVLVRLWATPPPR